MDIYEARRVIGDSTHPMHERYWASDPAIVRQVDDAFMREYPGAGADVTLDRLFTEAAKPRKKE